MAVLDPGTRASLYGAVAQVAVLQPTPVASVGNISGAPGVSATFDGSGSQFHHYYEWTWTSLPGGSALFNYPVLFPDNAVAAPIDMTDNVGLWHFDGDADDTSGNSNDGTVTGATLVSGKFGQCYDFDGSNDYITVAHSAELDATSAVSIALWIYVEDFGAWSGIVCKGTNTLNYGLNQAADGSGKLQFFSGGSPWTSYVQSTAVVPTGEWKHVAVTWDAGTVKFFIDGSLDSTHSVAWSLSTNSEALIIGADFPGASQYFNGKIDELALWTRVLSPTEITDIYDKQSKVGLGLPTALPDSGAGSLMVDNELLCHFEGNANDTSGNARNGTVNGATQVTGKIGSNAYSFDGTNDTIDFGANLQYTTGDFSFSIWVKPAAAQNSWALIFGTHGDTTGYGLQQLDANTNLYRFQSANGSAYFANGTYFVLDAGIWSHVIITRSGTVIKGYVNGSHVYTDVAPTTYSNNQNFNLGDYLVPGWDLHWAGEMDELASWSRALSPVEITGIYNQQSRTGRGATTTTADFTPDVAGTYTVQLEVADGVSVTADAVISIAGGSLRSNAKYFTGFAQKRKTIFAGSLTQRLANRKVK